MSIISIFEQISIIFFFSLFVSIITDSLDLLLHKKTSIHLKINTVKDSLFQRNIKNYEEHRYLIPYI